jgi:hypothetical protein
VVVIHGVGVEGPGTTLDSLLEGLGSAEVRAQTPKAGQLGPMKTPEVLLPNDDHAPPDAAVEKRRFPMHVRRFQRTATSPEVVFTEAYWADLTATETGLGPMLIRAFTIIFDLSLVCDAAAACRHFGPSRALRRAMYWVSFILCGPIAGLNAFLLYLLVANFALDSIGGVARSMSKSPWASSIVLGAMLGLIIFSLYYWRLRSDHKHGSYLFIGLGFVLAGLGGLAGCWYIFTSMVGIEWNEPQSLQDSTALNRAAHLWLQVGILLVVLSAGLTYIARKDRWGSFGWLLLDLGLAAGLGVTVTFLVYGLLPHPDVPLFREVGMLGYSAAGAWLGFSLAEWGRRRNPPWNSTWILLYRTLGIVSVVVAALAVCRLWRSPTVYETGPGGQFVRRFLGLSTDRFDPFETYLAFVMFVIRSCFVLLAVPLFWSVLVAANAWRLARRAKKRGSTGTIASMQSAVEAAVSAMMLQVGLWVVAVPAIGLLALNRFAPDQIAKDHPLFDGVWRSFVLHLLIGCVLGVCFTALWFGRTVWAGQHLPRLRQPRNHPVPRLIANRWFVMLPLTLFSFLGIVLFLWNYSHGLLQALGLTDSLPPTLGTGVQNWLQEWGRAVVGVAAAMLSIATFLFADGIRDGLHIVSDVIAHFHRRNQAHPQHAPPVRVNLSSFPTEQRIEARVYRVLQHVFEVEQANRVIVLAHSQGSVIAVHSLWYPLEPTLLEETRKQLLLQGRSVTLVTMGSPFTHLYQTYFPQRYPPLFDEDGVFNDADWGSFQVHTPRWFNIFRLDDFVGTYVCGQANTYPVNREVHEGGHTDYWIDTDVLVQLLNNNLLPGRLS